MRKRELNLLITKLIVELSDETAKSIFQQSKIPPTSWYTWLESKEPCPGGSFPINALVDLCNVLRVPMRSLFKWEGDITSVPSVQDLYLPCGVFKPNRFDTERFISSFGLRSKANQSIKAMLKKLGVSRMTYLGWRDRERALRVFQLLSFCNLFGYDLFDFIIDPNTEASSSEQPEADSRAMSLPEDFTRLLQKERKELQKSNTIMRRVNNQLRDELQTVKTENLKLAARIKEMDYELERIRQQLVNLRESAYFSTTLVAEVPTEYCPQNSADEQLT